ncbi:MAG TPA: histidine kinase [Dermatophilaceae bacterium]|nr:histidine kinase [Dermatophilaceae bacterium]
MLISRWWSGRTGLERFDLATRWPLYLLSGLEPLVVVWLVLAQDQVRAAGAILLLLVTVAHTLACIALLRAGLAHLLGAHPPTARLVRLTVALTGAGLAAGVAAFPAYGRSFQGDLQLGYPVGLALAALFCGALTAAAAPMLRGGQLLAAVALPAAVVGAVQLATDAGDGHQGRWAADYLLWVGVAVLTYRVSVWYLVVLWEIDRSRDVQARLAVAEERLRFARDLHDVLGRNLTLIALNSELAAQLVRRGQDGAVEHMLEVRQVAQDSMREVREVAGGQRTTDLDSELAGARSVLRSAGISARVVGDGAGLSRPVQAALGWVVREATTNIIRHSDPTTVTIELDVVQDGDTGPAAVLRIENDGVHTPDSGGGATGGSGLAGLRARLAELGGDLDAEALSGGRYVVQVRLPLTRRSPVAATTAAPMP